MSLEKLEKVTIAQLGTILQVDEKTLRFWSDEFKEFIYNNHKIPRKLNDNQVEVFLKIKELLQTEMYTLQGAKRRLELDRTLSSGLGIEQNFKTTVFFMFSAIMQELQAAREESRNLSYQVEQLNIQKANIEEQLLEEQNKGLLEFLRGKISKAPEQVEKEKIS